MNEHVQRDHKRRGYRAPAWKGFPSGWVSRETCDRCRQPLAFGGINVALPLGTPVVCGPCTHEGPPTYPTRETIRNRLRRIFFGDAPPKDPT